MKIILITRILILNLYKETDVYEFALAGMSTTGNYLTLDSPCNNKKNSVISLTIHMLNREIIISTHMALLSKLDLPIEAQKTHLFPGLNKALI